MAKFVIRRFALAVVLLAISSVIIFYGMRAAPGSVAPSSSTPITTTAPTCCLI